ncbi:hypothetical protein GGI17_001916 [Coemansia sp. S146]|nr:hypothetical protein GGI17_001916 [Coemansia sp. S146]
MFQQFMDEFAKPLGSYAWTMQARHRPNGYETTLQSLPVEELEPKTQVLLYLLLNTSKEGMAKLSARWQVRTELHKKETPLLESKAMLEIQEVQVQMLRAYLKNATANAVGDEVMTRKYEYMARTVDAVCNKPRHDALAVEVERVILALKEEFRLESQQLPELLTP